MILLLMVLVSLSTIYFTLLLEKKRMRTAAVMVVVLFSYIILWTYAVFIIDVADLGFAGAETQASLLHGSNIYHSFVDLTEKMSSIPRQLLDAIVFVAALVIVAGLTVVFHGVFEFAKELLKFFNGKERRLLPYFQLKILHIHEYYDNTSILRMHCRANC